MPDVLPWLEYRWSFDFPTGMYRASVERLRGTPARLDGPIRLVDLAFFAAEHDDHQLAAVHELLR